MSGIRVLFVDDHPLLRQGLASVLDAEDDVFVAGQAASGEEAIPLYRKLRPDVCLLDLRLRGIDGIETMRRIREDDPEARIIILSTSLRENHIFRALEGGARSYLTKDMDAAEFLFYVREVGAGRKVLPPHVASRMAERVGNATLSPREREVLIQVAQGASNKEIAALLGLSEQTVQTHMKNILGKLAVDDRTGAVTEALRRGMIDLGLE